MSATLRAAVPDLRIVSATDLYAHESHDSQRSRPLEARLRSDKYIINPPVVTPTGEAHFVILDGANRCHALRALGYPHVVVQVVSQESSQVTLDTWNHIVSDWSSEALLDGLRSLPGLRLESQATSSSLAELQLADGKHVSLTTASNDPRLRNKLLCQLVAVYQQRATLYRSVLEDLTQVREHFPTMVALLRFPQMQMADIISAAREKALIPPGISRHIIFGRALNINFPIRQLADENQGLAEKNAGLRAWSRQKLARREVRYYAEATWQFEAGEPT